MFTTTLILVVKFGTSFSRVDFHKLDLYETQNDYFKMEFNLKTDDEVAEFRKKLVKWGNKINNLGNYTYPTGFKSEEVLQDNEHEESENRYSKSS